MARAKSIAWVASTSDDGLGSSDYEWRRLGGGRILRDHIALVFGHYSATRTTDGS